MYVYTDKYAYKTINKKQVMNSKESKKGHMERFGARKGRGQDMELYNNFKTKINNLIRF